MAENENEILRKRVEQRKSDVAVMITAINRIEAHVLEEVVHPAHVPFETEPKTAQISGPRHAWPVSRFLGDCDDARETLVTNFVELFQEIDGVEIFTAAVNVRDPLTRFPR